MTSDRRVPRSFAVAAGLLFVAAVTALPATAANPTGTGDPDLRPARNAWDRQTGDDPGRLIVTFRPNTSTLGRQSSLTAAGATRRAAPIDQTTVVDVPDNEAASTTATLEADPRVERVSVDHKRFREADPTGETYWHEQWGLDNTGQDLYLGSPGHGRHARRRHRRPPGPRYHHGLGEHGRRGHRRRRGLQSSGPCRPGLDEPGRRVGGGKETNGIDDDGNGYIDDVHGWDFCHNDNTVHDFDDDYHGTHVAGIIAASLDGEGVVGVAPGISLMALKFLGDDPACGYDSQAIAAIAYAKSFGVRIANASWGGVGAPTDAPELYDAIKNSGMLFVAAAGNDANDNDRGPFTTLPASFNLPNIVSVAAVDNTGGLSSFSNYGATTVDIAAPGEGILSSLPADSDNPVGWGWLDGTSMATPHVTGVAALVASALPSMAGDLPALKARILGSGKPDSWTAGLTATGRMVDAYRALDMVAPVAAPPNSFGFVIGSQMSSTSAVVRVGWPAATDDLSGIGGYALGQRSGAGDWTTAVASTGARTADRTLAIGTAWGLRVRARDGAGNVGDWTTGSTITPARYQDTSSRVSYSGTWHGLTTSSASGGHERYSTRKGASVTFRFTGRAFALVAPKGVSRGSAKMYVDGVYISTVEPAPNELDASDRRRGTLVVDVRIAHGQVRRRGHGRTLARRRGRVPRHPLSDPGQLPR